MNYSIEVYSFQNQFVFTGILDMYFEKYKGEGPGVYSHPIIVLPSKSPIEDIQKALFQCERVLEDSKELIFRENTTNDYMQMETLLFRNFREIGIKASKSEIIKKSILVKIRKNDKPFICRCVPKGRNMIVQKKYHFPLMRLSLKWQNM